jgi:hypothetical protein
MFLSETLRVRLPLGRTWASQLSKPAETTLWSVCPLGIVRKEKDGLEAFEAFLPISEGR